MTMAEECFGFVKLMTNFKFGVCLAVLVLFGTCDGLRCMQCSKAPHFAHCENIVTCNETQLCYVEEQILFGQTLVYAGCKNRIDCDSEGCYGEENLRQKREATTGTRTSNGRELKCHHCCDSDFCNMYGCPDSLDVSHLTGSRCFNCEHSAKPEMCNKIKNCDPQQVCMLLKSGFGDVIRYKLGCERTAICARLEEAKQQARLKREPVMFHSECCSSHLCNGHDPTDTHPPSPFSVNYQCPSPPPLTTVVTQSISETTPTTQSTTPSTSTTTQTTTTSFDGKIVPILGPDCHDKAICSLYSRETACSMPFRDWARETCPVMCDLCDSGVELTTESSTDTNDCIDLQDCTIYGKDYVCRGEYIPWSKINCRAYCGFCQGNTSSVAKTKASVPCEDKIDCSEYGKDYACDEEFKDWAANNCPKFCGYCEDNPKPLAQIRGQSSTSPMSQAVTFTEAPTCADKEDCSVYGKDYVCTDEFRQWATVNCPKYCGLCDEVSTVVESTAAQRTSTRRMTVPAATTCEDKQDCSAYGKEYGCSDEFRQWAMDNCPKYCGLCDGATLKTTMDISTQSTPSVVTTQQIFATDCKDKIDCASYGYDYICRSDEFRPWATDNCPVFCGYC